MRNLFTVAVLIGFLALIWFVVGGTLSVTQGLFGMSDKTFNVLLTFAILAFLAYEMIDRRKDRGEGQ